MPLIILKLMRKDQDFGTAIGNHFDSGDLN
jgi:hypothetical protein